MILETTDGKVEGPLTIIKRRGAVGDWRLEIVKSSTLCVRASGLALLASRWLTLQRVAPNTRCHESSIPAGYCLSAKSTRRLSYQQYVCVVGLFDFLVVGSDFG